MKKIILILFLIINVLCGFATESVYKRVNFPVHENLIDGQYIICYEASSKAKIFQNFTDYAISVNRYNDSIIICDDSLSWNLEKIDDKHHFALFHNNLYLSSENVNADGNHNLILSELYGTVGIINSGEIWSYTTSNNGSYITYFIYYDSTTNKFVNNPRGSNNPNTKLYMFINYNITSGNIVNSNNNSNIQKVLLNDKIYILLNNRKYDIYGTLIQ